VFLRINATRGINASAFSSEVEVLKNLLKLIWWKQAEMSVPLPNDEGTMIFGNSESGEKQ